MIFKRLSMLNLILFGGLILVGLQALAKEPDFPEMTPVKHGEVEFLAPKGWAVEVVVNKPGDLHINALERTTDWQKGGALTYLRIKPQNGGHMTPKALIDSLFANRTLSDVAVVKSRTRLDGTEVRLIDATVKGERRRSAMFAYPQGDGVLLVSYGAPVSQFNAGGGVALPLIALGGNPDELDVEGYRRIKAPVVKTVAARGPFPRIGMLQAGGMRAPVGWTLWSGEFDPIACASADPTDPESPLLAHQWITQGSETKAAVAQIFAQLEIKDGVVNNIENAADGAVRLVRVDATRQGKPVRIAVFVFRNPALRADAYTFFIASTRDFERLGGSAFLGVTLLQMEPDQFLDDANGLRRSDEIIVAHYRELHAGLTRKMARNDFNAMNVAILRATSALEMTNGIAAGIAMMPMP